MTKEQILLERAKAFDQEAIAELYDRYSPKIYAYLYRRVHNVHLAEDLTGSVFVRVLQAIESEQFWHTSFQAWLYRIAHNLVIDHYRKNGTVAEVPLDEQRLVESEAARRAQTQSRSFEHLQSVITQLTPDQQHVLALRFGEGLKAREVAEIMGKTEGAVESLQHRALVALRKMVKEGE
jgi:RNA polymerase sigma-70 factor (ECF subfamily)